jgi:iron complex outermembrane recepter protein
MPSALAPQTNGKGLFVAAIWLCLGATPLLAQPGSPSAEASTTPSPPSTAIASERAAQVDTPENSTVIFVTATRRAENIQAVPLSVTAVTGQALEQNGIHDLRRLDVLVPGLKIGASGPDGRPAIRGTRTQQVVGNADPSVAFYSDGIYRSRPSQALATLLDVQRIEVLRGPQGTLFGRNSFSGAVNVISRPPTLDEVEARGVAEVTNFGGLRVEGVANLPIDTTAAVRVSGYVSRRDGWVRDLTDADHDLHDDDNQVLRGQLLWAPSSGFSNLLRVEYWHGGGAGAGHFGYFAPGVPVNVATGFTNGVSGIVNPVISAGTAGNPLVAGNPNYDGGFFGLTPGTLGDPDHRHISRNFPPARRINQLTVSDEATLDLGSFADLKGIVSFTDYDEYRQGDPDYSSQQLVYETNRNKTRTFSQELQLIGKPGTRLSWIAGLFFLQDRPTAEFSFGTDTGGVPVELYSADPNGYFSGPNGSYTDSYAAYADGTYAITEWLRVLGGLRYTEDKRRGFFNVNAGTTLPATSDVSARASFDRVTYRAGLQADVAPQVMIYGTYSTGFQAGGLNADSNPITSFSPTYSEAFEAGAKATLLDGKLRGSLALYSNRYRDIVSQVLQTLPNGAIVVISANAGEINAYGAEGELDFNPTPASTIGIRFAYNHSRFGEFIAPNAFYEGGNILAGNCTAYCPFQLADMQVPLNPTFSATLLASVDLDAGKAGVFTPSATAFYSSSYRTSDQPYFFADQDAYGTADVHLRWRSNPGSRYYLEAFVNNLTDQRILLRSTPNSGRVIFQDFADPRIYGLRIAVDY